MLTYQKGIGLIEVLVALLLLAVAVLGFSAMQMRAIKATGETLVRSDALVIIRNISEDMRLYPNHDQKTAYITAINSGNTTASKDCAAADDADDAADAACTETEQLQYNAAKVTSLAVDSNIQLGAAWCPLTDQSRVNNLRRVCLITSWNDTKPEMGADEKACADAQGTYKAGATCFVMESY